MNPADFNPCPLCHHDLDILVTEFMLTNSSHITCFDCGWCKRYRCSFDGEAELIYRENKRWWIMISKGVSINVYQPGSPIKEYPYVEINYQDPQETIDRLEHLKAFL